MEMFFANKDISYKRAVHPLPVEKGVLSAKIDKISLFRLI